MTDDKNIWQKYLAGELLSDELEIDQENDFENNDDKILVIDLHSYNQEDAFVKIVKSINYARENQINKIKIITGLNKKNGKITGSLFLNVPRWLEFSDIKKYIASFNEVNDLKGAFLVKLKNI